MFTGIIESTGTVASLGPLRSGPAGLAFRTLRIDAGTLFAESQAGASISINGVCLTLTAKSGSTADFEIVAETLNRTNLGALRPGSRVNLERALRPSDRMDGHFVQGHVDAVGRVDKIEHLGGGWKLWIETDGSAMRCIVPKGSITLDGTSLTVVDAAGARFSVVLIPTTLDRTSLGDLRTADAVNIETDIISRTIITYLDRLGLADPPASGQIRDSRLMHSLRESGMIP